MYEAGMFTGVSGLGEVTGRSDPSPPDPGPTPRGNPWNRSTRRSVRLTGLLTSRGRGRRAASRACAALLEASSDLAVILRHDGTMGYASPAATRMLGRPSPWLAGHPLAALVHPDDRARLAELCRCPSPGQSGALALAVAPEIRISHINGDWIPVEVMVSDLRDEPAVRGIVVTMRDMARQKATLEELRRLALHDPLTNLANRDLFREHVEQALARERRAPVTLAVLFIDLDGFKTINDSLGHGFGDDVLVAVANRFSLQVRPGDTPARLGGDEFAVLMESSSESDAVSLARRLGEHLRDPIVLHGREVVVSGSIGIAVNTPGLDADGIMRNADVAMYRAKTSGKGRFEVFQPEMQHAALKRLVMEADLRHAVDRQELVLQYQPIVNLETGRTTGMEALVRWRHPQRGLLPPADFIEPAEDSGIIRPLGRWVLTEACRQGRGWADLHPEVPRMTMCVNVSVRQIVDERFAGEVAHCLAETGFDPTCLVLEITESLFLNDFEETLAKLSELKQLGLQLAIDDFGTGYSSLNYLRYLPIDLLKIDKSFVAGVTRGAEQSAVARAVITLARTLSLRTVAEGIETAEQMSVLRRLGADMGQGFYLARPLDQAAVDSYLSGPPLAPAPRTDLAASAR